MNEDIDEKSENESYIQVAIRVCIFTTKLFTKKFY